MTPSDPLSFRRTFPDILQDQTPWTIACLVGLLAAALFLVGLNNHGLWDYHEPYVGGIIHEMTMRGAWVVPTLNGQPYLEKPPLYYLLGVLSCRFFGLFDPWTLRLPSAVLAIGTVMWVGWVGARAQSPRAGLWAGELTATHVLFFQMGHRAVVDITLTATVTLVLGLAYLALVEEDGRWWAQLFWAGQGLVFLAKGVVGPVMVVLPVGVALGCLGERRKVAAFLRPGWGMAVGLGLALAWVVPLALAGGREYLMEVFVRNSLGRFIMHPDLVSKTGRLDEHREPFYFYLERTPGNLLPWVGLWGVALARGLAKGLARGRRFGVAHWCLPVFFLVTLALLTASSAKRMVYLLPVFPVTFLHAALWLDDALEDPARPGLGARGALWGSVVLVGLLGTVLPWFVRVRVGLAWPVAVCMSLPAFLLGIIAVVAAARRLPGAALAWSMTQWVVTLLAFLLLAVPELDREWNPILEPYREARKLELLGAQVHEGRLGEGQVGLVNLTFGHRLPPVATPEAVRGALARPEPVAVLLESRHFWMGALKGRVEGAIQLPFEALRTEELRDRAPVLLLNPQALDLLVGGRDEEPEAGPSIAEEHLDPLPVLAHLPVQEAHAPAHQVHGGGALAGLRQAPAVEGIRVEPVEARGQAQDVDLRVVQVPGHLEVMVVQADFLEVRGQAPQIVHRAPDGLVDLLQDRLHDRVGQARGDLAGDDQGSQGTQGQGLAHIVEHARQEGPVRAPRVLLEGELAGPEGHGHGVQEHGVEAVPEHLVFHPQGHIEQ